MTLAQRAKVVGLAWARGQILRMLARHGHNWSRAAREAEMDRTNFRRLARRVGVRT